MLDTVVGKAHNIAVATLPNFVYAHDIPPSSRYWHEDFMLPLVEIDADSCVAVPNAPGIGFDINPTCSISAIATTRKRFNFNAGFSIGASTPGKRPLY